MDYERVISSETQVSIEVEVMCADSHRNRLPDLPAQSVNLVAGHAEDVSIGAGREAFSFTSRFDPKVD
jgi:hypothetical protein